MEERIHLRRQKKTRMRKPRKSPFWWKFTKCDLLKSKLFDGNLKVAGYSALPKEVPQDVTEKAPAAPQLGKIVITGTGSDQTLTIPDAILKKWYHHPIFGTRFRAFVDAFYEESFCASLSGLSGVIVLVM